MVILNKLVEVGWLMIYLRRASDPKFLADLVLDTDNGKLQSQGIASAQGT